MRKNKLLRKMTALILAVMTTASLAACGGGSGSDSGSEQLKDTINVSYNAQPSTFDPHITGATATAEIDRLVFERLFELDDKGVPHPQLAESYTVSEDNKEWTFKLRQGVKFHNGEEMKADDVVASLNRWLSKSAIAAKAIQTNNEQFEKVDDYTVKISLENPCIMMTYILANFAQAAYIMPASVIEAAGSNNISADQLIGTSSLKFAEWSVDNYVKLEKFDDYKPFTSESSGSYGDRSVNFKTAMIYFITDTTTRLNGLQTGEYDISASIAYSDVDRLKTMDGVSMYTSMFNGLTITMNKSKDSRLSDPKWRQVISYAVNLNDIMEGSIPTVSGYKAYEANAGYFAKDSDWYTDLEQASKQDTEKAKQLLKELNYDGTPLVMMTTEAYPEFYNACLIMKQELEAVGVNVTLNVYDWGTMLTKLAQTDAYDLYPMNYPLDDNPASINYIRKANASGFTNDAQLDSYIKEMNAKATVEEAQSFWKDTIQPYCQEETFIINLGDYDYIYGASDKVTGFTPYYGLRLWGVKVAQ